MALILCGPNPNPNPNPNWRSPYLLGICGYVLLLNLVTSFIQFEKGFIVQATNNRARITLTITLPPPPPTQATYSTESEMLYFYAQLNTAVSLCTLFVQLTAAGKVIITLSS